MATTTIRIDSETHKRLTALSKSGNKQIIDVVREATAALERVRFAAGY